MRAPLPGEAALGRELAQGRAGGRDRAGQPLGGGGEERAQFLVGEVPDAVQDALEIDDQVIGGALVGRGAAG